MSKKSKHLEDMNDDEIIDFYITQEEDERTVMSKNDTKIRWATMDAAHTSKGKAAPSFKHKMKIQARLLAQSYAYLHAASHATSGRLVLCTKPRQ